MQWHHGRIGRIKRVYLHVQDQNISVNDDFYFLNNFWWRFSTSNFETILLKSFNAQSRIRIKHPSAHLRSIWKKSTLSFTTNIRLADSWIQTMWLCFNDLTIQKLKIDWVTVGACCFYDFCKHFHLHYLISFFYSFAFTFSKIVFEFCFKTFFTQSGD
jgi:hydroxyacyl-ACP dehydratase HTD2-like protein with hotdog domain